MGRCVGPDWRDVLWYQNPPTGKSAIRYDGEHAFRWWWWRRIAEAVNLKAFHTETQGSSRSGSAGSGTRLKHRTSNVPGLRTSVLMYDRSLNLTQRSFTAA